MNKTTLKVVALTAAGVLFAMWATGNVPFIKSLVAPKTV